MVGGCALAIPPFRRWVLLPSRGSSKASAVKAFRVFFRAVPKSAAPLSPQPPRTWPERRHSRQQERPTWSRLRFRRLLSGCLPLPAWTLPSTPTPACVPHLPACVQGVPSPVFPYTEAVPFTEGGITEEVSFRQVGNGGASSDRAGTRNLNRRQEGWCWLLSVRRSLFVRREFDVGRP